MAKEDQFTKLFFRITFMQRRLSQVLVDGSSLRLLANIQLISLPLA
jgi:hypothetical protein